MSPRDAFRGLRRFSTQAGTRDLALALVLKAGGSLLAFVMLTLAARAMGLHEFGVFAYWFSAVSFAAAAILLGQEAAFMVDWQKALDAGQPSAARSALRRSSAIVLSAAVLGGGMTACAALMAGADAAFSASAGLFAALLATLTFGTHVGRVVAGIAQGDGQFEVTWRLFPIAGAALALLAGWHFGAEAFFLWASVGILVALGAQMLGIGVALRAAPPAAPAPSGMPAAIGSRRDWAKRSAQLWLGGVLEAANQYADVFVIGLLLSPADAGLYYAASRLAAVFSIVAAGLHVYSSREVARHSADPAGAGMRQALRLVGGATVLAVSGGLVVTVFGGTLLLGLFGPKFEAAYLPLVILTVGVTASLLGGPVPAVMRLTGHEAIYARIVAASVVARGICVAAGAAGGGLVGATLGSAFCSLAFAVTLNSACRRQVGVDPSVLGLIAGRRLVRRQAS